MITLDLICPVYHVDWNFFSSNVDSWMRQLPINKMIFGIANKDKNEAERISNYLTKKYPDHVIIIDQRDKKTLGYCLSQLIDNVSTEWFAYVHSDAELTFLCFEMIKCSMADHVGIIESERIHFDGEKFSYDPYHFSNRAYSGFQVMRKEAVDLEFDDDYIYRNEDMIFQNNCLENGYHYIKSWAMHIHQTTTTKKWTHERENTYEMQWKGLVKYTTPTEITMQAVKDALHVCINEFNHDVKTILKEMHELDPIWFYSIAESILKK